MKHKRHKNKSKHEKKKSKKKDENKHKKQMCNESDSNSSINEEIQKWVEKAEVGIQKREVRCHKPDLDKLGQNDRELNPYWKNGGNGLPEETSTKVEQVMDINWLKKSFQRAKEQAERENRSLEEIAAERWGSLEVIESMISKAKDISTRNTSKFKNQFDNSDKCGSTRESSYIKSSNKSDQYKKYNDSQYENYQKEIYKKPMNDECFYKSSYKINHSGKKNWQKYKISNKNEEKQSSSNMFTLENSLTNNTNDIEAKEIKSLTEAEMNKLGAKIVKAEIMGNIKLADELKIQLKEAREVAKSFQVHNTEKIQNIILTQTDMKGVTRPLELRSQSIESSQNVKRKNAETYVSGKKVRHYFDDDKYSLQKLFQKEKGRSTNEDEAAFVKVASKNVDMDEIFEEHITHVKSDVKQNEKDRLLAINEHKRLSKSLDNCHWCIDSKYMLKHMIIAMDSEICLSLPRYTSLTFGHCIITPIHHVACQLQLDENIWEKLKIFKRTLYKMFMDQNQYPVFYEIYKSRYKFLHMQLECVPLPKEVGELAPMYFKKALLECETEWSMNKKIISLEHKDVRQAIPSGLSYFMVEFEKHKGYAHIIEDEHVFPKYFAEEIIGGMLDLDHDMWRKPKQESFDQQRKKVLKFSEIWKKYQFEIKNYN